VARLFYTVREGQEGDAKAMRAIEKECFGRGAWTLAEFKDALRKKTTKSSLGYPTKVWVAEYVGKMAGFVLAWYERDPMRKGKMIPHIGSIDTAVKHRGKGVATMLLDQAHAHFRRLDHNRISLQVSADNPAQCLYFRLGYRTVRFMPRCTTALGNGGALWMEKML
jgi:ribosomal protein S18 acetylase RimI-like enzyme